MADKPEETPRILVDSDWKEQARREKEELDRQTREEQAAGAGGIPEPSFGEIIQMIIIQASLGFGFQDPTTGQNVPPNLAVARHYIDLLDLLRQKTENNLDENERAMLEGTLHELQMAYVQFAGVGTGPGPQAPPAQP